MDKIAIRYIPELNIYHLKVNEREKPVTLDQLTNLRDKHINALSEMAMRFPWSWCNFCTNES